MGAAHGNDEPQHDRTHGIDLPIFARNGRAQSWENPEHLVNSWTHTGPLQAVYFASKAFVSSFSNAIAEEMHDKNITVTALLPVTTETGFAKISGVDKTAIFSNPSSARAVAEDGYNAMMRGEIDVISVSSKSQKMQLSLVPFFPKKILLKQTRLMQEPR